MKTLFDIAVADELMARIDTLSSSAEKQWGKMNVAQMLAHCTTVLHMGIGIVNPKRELIGWLIGPLVKSNYYNEKPFDRNVPTTFPVKEQKNFDRERQQLKQNIITFQENGAGKCTTHPHPFLGRLTPEQWGIGMYKHLDHHLRQFGV